MARAIDRRREARVIRLCRKGRALLRRGERSEALRCFLDAWTLLPEPTEAASASAFVLAGIGDLLRTGVDPFVPLERRRRARGTPAPV